MEEQPTSMMALPCVKVVFDIGHKAIVKSTPTPEGFTHDWQLFVRGADNTNIHFFIDKVVFHLHETFPNPRRVIKEPPYVLKESGYASFLLAIYIYLKNKDEPRKIRFDYELVLPCVDLPILCKVTRETYVFIPSEDFRQKLIKGGGTSVVSHDETEAKNSTSSSAVSKQKSITNTNQLPSPPPNKNKKEVIKLNNTYSTLFGSSIQPPKLPLTVIKYYDADGKLIDTKVYTLTEPIASTSKSDINPDFHSSSESSLSVCSSEAECNLSTNTPKKNKLKMKVKDLQSRLKQAELNVKRVEQEKNKLQQLLAEPGTLEQFKQMCEQFLPNQLSSNFVKTQAELNSKSIQGKRYSKETKQFALMLHFFGPEVYRFLRKTWCLPTERMLQRETEKWEIGVGFSDFLFKVLSLKGRTMTTKSKECVLCADEMSLKSFLYYNYSKDEIIGFHEENTHKKFEITKNVLVLMIRGIHVSWKQPLAYFFVSSSCSGNSLKSVIFNCINKLSLCSFNVKAVISDLRSNFKLFSETVGVTPDKPFFCCGKLEISYIFDPPHLLKATRDIFFKYKFLSDGKTSDFKFLKQFYDTDKMRTRRLAPKLTEMHMKPNNIQKKEVKLAAQVFSKTVVSGMKLCMEEGSLSLDAVDTVDFIDHMDNLFDLFNSRPKPEKKISEFDSDNESSSFKPKEAKHFLFEFKGSESQNNLLNIMFNYFKNLKVQVYNSHTCKWNDVLKKCNIKFINGWMISIAGLQHLFTNLKSKSINKKIKICTRRLNQDCLENLFGTVRIQNGNCINPSCIQFKRTFKKLFCTNYFEYSEGENCIDDLDNVLTSFNKLPAEELSIIFPSKKKVKNVCSLPINPKHYRSLELPKLNTLKYICGFLMSKCLKVHKCNVCLDFAHSTTMLSRDNFFRYFEVYECDTTLKFSSLIMPDSAFYQFIFEIDLVFINNFESLLILPNVGLKIKQSMNNNVSFHHPCQQFPKEYLLNLFIRFRIYTSLTRTNRHLNLPSIKSGKNTKIQIISHL